MAKIPEESYPNKTGGTSSESAEVEATKAWVDPEMSTQDEADTKESEESEEK